MRKPILTAMNTEFKHIFESLIKEGFHQLTEGGNEKAKDYDYKITPYSLNSKLSFKFENLAHFTAFLKLSENITPEAETLLHNSLTELNINPTEFFYVNFYEKGKDLEM